MPGSCIFAPGLLLGNQALFFVPMDLVDDQVEAEDHLRQKYADHECRPPLSSQVSQGPGKQ